jgi:hypothetical protein
MVLNLPEVASMACNVLAKARYGVFWSFFQMASSIGSYLVFLTMSSYLLLLEVEDRFGLAGDFPIIAANGLSFGFSSLLFGDSLGLWAILFGDFLGDLSCSNSFSSSFLGDFLSDFSPSDFL